jgi:glycosyltransferase involved in cell wall biosynthesis
MPHAVHVTTVHRPFDVRVFHKELQSLVRAGYEASLVAPHNRAEVVGGVRVEPVPVPGWRPARMTLGAVAAAARAGRLKPDVLHFHDPELIPACLVLARLTGARLVYDAHENFYEQVRGRAWIPSRLRGTMALTVLFWERVCGLNAHGVVAATETIARRFPKDKTVVVKNYPLPRTGENAHRTRDWKMMIHTGGLNARRGAAQMARALDMLATPDARLVLLGDPPPPEIPETLLSGQGRARVEWPGSVPHGDVAGHLEQAGLGLLLYQPGYGHETALPNKLFEYLAAGLPVIASNFPAWRQIIEGANAGVVVNPEDPAEIAHAMDLLLQNPALAARMGENARGLARSAYSWESEEKKLLGLYAKILGKRDKTAP